MHFDQTFWVGLSFVLFVALAWKPVARLLVQGVDNRADRIQKELDEALRLKEEAQALLSSYQKKQKEMQDEAKKIIQHAEEESKRITQEAEENLEVALSKRIEMSMQKISTYETAVLRDIRNNTVDVTINTVRSLVAEYLDKDTSEDLAQKAIQEINKKLH